MIKLLKQAIEKWGVEAQLNLAEEECAELIVELKKFRRGRNHKDDVCGEIADVEIMCAQLRLMFDSPVDITCNSTVDYIKAQKLERLRGRING